MYPKAIIWNSDTYLPKDINSNITIKKWENLRTIQIQNMGTVKWSMVDLLSVMSCGKHKIRFKEF